MSFTAEVKDELSRLDSPYKEDDIAELSALIKVCGTLSLMGSGTYAVRIATETGSVARSIIRYAHTVFNLETTFTPRRSILHKSRNYLIEMPAQPGLKSALSAMGILVPGKGLMQGIPTSILRTRHQQAAFLRGVFMAGGFIADPRVDFHLELCVGSEELAQDLLKLFTFHKIGARMNKRRGAFALYVKNFEDIESLLLLMDAKKTAKATNNARRLKLVKNSVNRMVNAEIANQKRATGAAARQIELIQNVEKTVGIENLSSALQQFCKLRLAHPEASLAEIGELSRPPSSKSAMYHRLLRLEELLENEKNHSLEKERSSTEK